LTRRVKVDGLQARLVVFLDVDAARAQFGHLGGQVVHPPGGLGLRLARPGGAPRDDEPAIAPARERQEVLALDQDLEPDPVAVELPRDAEIGRQNHHVYRVL
jgi:hypothetical protein